MDEVPQLMHAVRLTGFGGFDMLEYRTDVEVPTPRPDGVLIRVAAAGVNNTDINTRVGWYSKSVGGATDSAGAAGFGDDVADDGGWAGEALEFPRIQGADVAGRIVAVGADVDPVRVGQRVLVRSMQDATAEDGHCVTVGSELDGGFAQFCAVSSSEAFAVECDWSDVELATLPCAYSTAEAMLHRIDLGSGERVLITGASGGVGSAALQLAKRRGAHVTGVASESKWEQLTDIGADVLLPRDVDLVASVGSEAFDVVVDVVAGPSWPSLLEALRRGGRYVTAGAIAGPIVELDVRTLYLKDLTLVGSTCQDRIVFENLVGYVERGEIQPLVSATYPLADIELAQRDFLDKGYVGKLVLVPPPLDAPG